MAILPKLPGTNKSRFLFIAILLFVISIVLRMYLVNAAGYASDLNWFRGWSMTMAEKGFSGVYIYTQGGVTTDYPPVYLSILGILGQINNNYLHWDYYGAQFTSLLKFMNACFDIVCGIVILLICQQLKIRKRSQLAVVAIWLFNPVVLMSSAVWGQMDNILLLFLLLAILMALKKQAFFIGLYLSFAILTKAQAIIFLPIFAVFLWKKYKLTFTLKAILSGVITTFILTIPVIASGRLTQLIEVYTTAAGRYPYLTLNAYNIWWLGADPKNFSALTDSVEILPGVTAKLLGLVLFGLFYLLTVYFLHRKATVNSFITSLCLVSMMFYLLPTQMHERYMYVFFGLFLLISQIPKKVWSIYFVLSGSIFVNLIYALNINSQTPITQFYPNLTYVLVVLNLLCFLVLYFHFALSSGEGSLH